MFVWTPVFTWPWWLTENKTSVTCTGHFPIYHVVTWLSSVNIYIYFFFKFFWLQMNKSVLLHRWNHINIASYICQMRTLKMQMCSHWQALTAPGPKFFLRQLKPCVIIICSHHDCCYYSNMSENQVRSWLLLFKEPGTNLLTETMM